MLVGVADDVRDAGKAGQLFRGTLRVAPRDHDPGLRVFPMNTADCGAGVLVGGGSDGTSVEDYDFSSARRGSALQSVLLELALDSGSVSLGGAAAKVLYVESRHGYYSSSVSGPTTAGPNLRD